MAARRLGRRCRGDVGGGAYPRAVLATLADAPDDHAILAAVGTGAFHRGLAYAREGRVSRLEFHAAKRVLTASVRGSSARNYLTVVRFGDPRRGEAVSVTGSCTCPVGASCKHVAAAVFAARRSPGLASPDLIATGAPADPVIGPAKVPAPWEAAITNVLAPRADDGAARGVPIGLQFDVVPPSPANQRAGGPASKQPRVLLRPVVPGAKGGWIRTGISWREIVYGYPSSARNAEHRDVLRVFHAQATPRTAYSYGSSDVPVDLATVGPGLWRLLEEVVAAGVALVPARASAGPVRLASDGAHLLADVRRHTEAGDASFDPLVVIGSDRYPGSAAWFLGAPAHGVAILGDQTGVPRADGAPSIVLAPLVERATAQVTTLMSAGRLLVPADDVERFVGDYYPVLRQTLTVTSSDASVAFPEIEPPSLALRLTHEPGHRVALDWSFSYRVGKQVTRVPLAGASSGSSLRVAREAVAEARLVEGVPIPADRLLPLRERAGGLASHAELAGMDAVVLLEELLPAVREAGVHVEEEGEAAGFRLSEAAPLIRVSTTDSDDRDWFDLGVDVSIDGEEVPFARLFTALAQGQTHLLLDSGTYFSVERPEYETLRRLIEEARGLVDRDGPPRLSRYQVSLWEDLCALGVVETQSERWAAAAKGLSVSADVARPAVPEGLRAELRPYQLEGYHWLTFLWEHELGGVLADDMGLGKTLQTLAAVARAKEHAEEEGRVGRPVLVVAPTSVVPNWAREAARFTPGLRVATVEETRSRRGTTLADHVAGADVVVTSYALFRIEYDAYDALPWSALVLDEAQFVKNYQAKTYQCARRLAAPVKIAITGTPLENSLMDLWAMLSIVAPGLFPHPSRFTDVYRNPIEREGNGEKLATLRRRIRPLMRRRTKEQVAADLPPKLEHVLEVELNQRHRTIYDRQLQRERQKVLGLIEDMNKNRFEIFRSLTLLRQLSLDPALVDPAHAKVGSAKVEVLLENLRDVVDGGHRALVFSQFTSYLRVVRERLDAEGVPHVYLDGRTRNRAARIEEFREGTAPVFLISLKAGGFGLNLTEADYCFVLDPWWNPAAEAQAVDRTHRIGQDKTVMVYRLVSAGTIEEKVMALKARKQDLFARVMDDDALMAGPLTADDIRGLFG